MNEIGRNAEPTQAAWRAIGIVWTFTAAALLLASATLRRRTP